MPREEPYFRKCCFCIPLKSCLQTWSVIKSMADITISSFLLVFLIILTDTYFYGFSLDEFTLQHAIIILIVVLIIDSVFMVVLSVGLSTNNLRSLRVFYYYSIYMVVAGAIFVVGMIIYCIVKINIGKYNALFTVFVVLGCTNTALDVCVIVTLKSEMIKLRNKQQYEFVTMPTFNKEDEPAEPFQADEEYLN